MFPTTVQFHDQELAKRVIASLANHRPPGATKLRIHAKACQIVISGKVMSEHDKWLSLQCCQHVAGVVRVIDQLVVSGRTR